MRIYNKAPGRRIAHWNAEDKTTTRPDGVVEPCQPLTQYVMEPELLTDELPDGLANHLLAKYPKSFSADKKALAAEQRLKLKLETANNRVADLESFIVDLRARLSSTAAPKDKKTAMRQAQELDTMLAGFERGKPIPKVKTAVEPADASDDPVEAAPPKSATEQADFEKKG